MARIAGIEYPEHLFYDIENQIWYDRLGDGLVRVGFTTWAVAMMGEVLVFTPKRDGKEFKRDKSFAVIEGGKWVGSARSAFDGVVVDHNAALIRDPGLLMRDAFGEGWMILVRPAAADWNSSLTTGNGIGPAFGAWIGSEAYKARTE